jgi:Na+/H+-dicarboxylate symporter
LTTSFRSRRRVRKVLRFLVIGVAGALLSTLLHRTLDVRFGRVVVGGLAGFFFGVALGVAAAEDRADRLFYAAVFGTICAVFSSASVAATLP